MRSICCFAVCFVALSVLLLTPAYALPPNPGELSYTPEQIANTSAEIFLSRMQTPEPGYWQFAAMNALSAKAKGSDTDTRGAILDLVISVMNDTTRDSSQRWQCCYVISGSGDERGVPALVQILLHDPSEVIRSVAAEALAGFPRSKEAYDALLLAASTETSPRVLEVIDHRMSRVMAPPEWVAATDAQRKMAQDLRRQVWDADPGKPKFDAIDAVAKTCRESYAADKRVILVLFISTIHDTSFRVNQRWPCCYVIGRSADERGLPDVIQVLLNDQIETMRAVAAETLGPLKTNMAARNAMIQAARTETAKSVRDVLTRYLGKEMPALQPIIGTDAQRKFAEDLLQQLWKAGPGKAKFDAIDAVAKVCRETDLPSKRVILALFISTMNDKSVNVYQRWPCTYVIGRSADEQGIPDVIQILLNDRDETMRSVAAETLGLLKANATVHDALLQSARTETAKSVRDVLAKYLGAEMPAL